MPYHHDCVIFPLLHECEVRTATQHTEHECIAAAAAAAANHATHSVSVKHKSRNSGNGERLWSHSRLMFTAPLFHCVHGLCQISTFMLRTTPLMLMINSNSHLRTLDQARGAGRGRRFG